MPKTLAPKVGNRYASSSDKSPTQEKSGKNGSTKVIRVHLQCVCGKGWHVLVGKRNKSRSVCPDCHQLRFVIDANKKDETFSVDLELTNWSSPTGDGGTQ